MVTVVVTALVHEAIALALFLVGARRRSARLSVASLGWLLIAVPLQIALTVGLGLLLASLHVFLRDVAQALGLVFSAWFYFTPIVYPLARVPEAFRPLDRAQSAHRAGRSLPQRAARRPPEATRGFVALVAAAALLLALGVLAFRRLSPSFADEL